MRFVNAFMRSIASEPDTLGVGLVSAAFIASPSVLGRALVEVYVYGHVVAGAMSAPINLL